LSKNPAKDVECLFVIIGKLLLAWSTSDQQFSESRSNLVLASLQFLPFRLAVTGEGEREILHPSHLQTKITAIMEKNMWTGNVVLNESKCSTEIGQELFSKYKVSPFPAKRLQLMRGS
jgi:hypothetical protein